MKKFLWIIAAVALVSISQACSDKDDDNNAYVNLDKYKDWKVQNEQWFNEMAARKNPDGSDYYTKVTPNWNPAVYVLMHYFNDRKTTAENLSPLYTSFVNVRYIGYNCENEAFDSSTLIVTDNVLGISRFQCNQVIQGWSIALMDMHVGDTAEIVIPYELAYNIAYTGAILPYSALRFNVRLEDIFRYEATL